MGQAGVTHCGSWIPVCPCREHGWATRLVCNREADHRGRHRSTYGARMEWDGCGVGVFVKEKT